MCSFCIFIYCNFIKNLLQVLSKIKRLKDKEPWEDPGAKKSEKETLEGVVELQEILKIFFCLFGCNDVPEA